MGKEITIKDKTPDKGAETELEFKKHLTSIHHQLGNEKQIGPDYIFTSLEGKNQEFVTESIHNASYGLMIYKRIKENTKKWKWNKEEQKWTKEHLTDTEKGQIEEMSQQLYKIQTIRPNMTVTFNLNKKDNNLIRWLLNVNDKEEEEHQENIKDKGMFEKLAEKLRGTE